MPPTDSRGAAEAESGAQACLNHTRSAVLNVLVAVGLMIAATGWLLRTRPSEKRPHGKPAAYRRLLIALAVISVTSYVAKRVLSGATRRIPESRRPTWFLLSHFIPAVIAAAAAPLGLVCGWFVDPRLGAVSPFWIAALALGFLSVPRQHEIEDLEWPQRAAGEGAP